MKRHPICWSLSVLALLAGCGSDSGGPTVPPVPEGAQASPAPAKGAAKVEKGKGGGTSKGPTATIND